MQKKFIILSIIIVGTVLLFFFIANRKYTISEITADNYKDLLVQEYNEDIFCCGTFSYLNNITFLKNAKIIISTNNKRYKIIDKRTVGNNLVIEVQDFQTGIFYMLVYYKGTASFPFTYSVYTMDNPKEIKRAITVLLLKEEFTFKKSVTNNVNNILIKETDNFFIIGYVPGGFDDATAFNFEVYRKDKKMFK